jgi:hypothetical protein
VRWVGADNRSEALQQSDRVYNLDVSPTRRPCSDSSRSSAASGPSGKAQRHLRGLRAAAASLARPIATLSRRVGKYATGTGPMSSRGGCRLLVGDQRTYVSGRHGCKGTQTPMSARLAWRRCGGRFRVDGPSGHGEVQRSRRRSAGHADYATGALHRMHLFVNLAAASELRVEVSGDAGKTIALFSTRPRARPRRPRRRGHGPAPRSCALANRVAVQIHVTNGSCARSGRADPTGASRGFVAPAVRVQIHRQHRSPVKDRVELRPVLSTIVCTFQCALLSQGCRSTALRCWRAGFRDGTALTREAQTRVRSSDRAGSLRQIERPLFPSSGSACPTDPRSRRPRVYTRRPVA